MKIGKILLAALLIAGVIIAIFLLPVRQWFMHFESYVQSLGRRRAGGRGASLHTVYRAVYSGKRADHRFGNSLWLNHGVCRRILGRQPGRAHCFSTGANLVAG